MPKRLKKQDFDVRACDVVMPFTYRGACPPYIFPASDDFYRNLKRYDFCDVMTYSVSASSRSFCKVRRLILAIVPPWEYTQLASEIRLCITNHAKLFLGYETGKVTGAFVGSLNLTNGFNFNLMVQLTKPKDIKYLTQLFENMWLTGTEI